MSIWDSLKNSCEKENNQKYSNLYLEDEKKSLELLALILPKKKKWNKNKRINYELDEILNKKLPRVLDEAQIDNSWQIRKKLLKLSDALVEYKKLRLLKGKSIVGVGGQFSAGKSCFINSRMESDAESDVIYLPENQIPTTSVPTYIMAGEKNIVRVFSDGEEIELDNNALDAFTHEFYDKYRIGLGRFVQCLAISVKSFPENLADRIVFLDTPGYSKADKETRRNNVTDRKIAEQQLRSVDFLIWLINITGGTINSYDIDFLKKFNDNTPFLVVFTHADSYPDSTIKEVIAGAEKILEREGLQSYGVTAYSSSQGVEYLGKNLIDDFLKMAMGGAEKKINIKDEILMLLKQLEELFEKRKRKLGTDLEELERCLKESEDIFSIKTLVQLYEDNVILENRLQVARKRYMLLANKIRRSIEYLMK